MQVIDLAVRPSKGATPERVLELSCDPEAGVIGDHGSSRRRQITLLSTEQWQSACEQVGQEVAWTTRRANLLVSGGSFGPEHDGRKLRIGEVEILIHGELVPCQQMEDQQPGLLQSLQPDWRGGLHGEIISAGTIHPGDDLEVLD